MMKQSPVSERRAGGWALVWISVALALGAGSLVPWLRMALDTDDTEALESPLVLAVARQLVEGPWGLYGPYGEQNPLVLIHAPLYYRLAAVLAWPLARAGLDPVSAALVAGRSLSVLGLLATLVAAFRLARLGGARGGPDGGRILVLRPRRSTAGVPFEVRPDMLGVGFQTTGVLLLLAALRGGTARRRGFLAAFACFGLAAGIKQLFVVAPAISTVLLLAAWRRGRLASKAIARVSLSPWRSCWSSMVLKSGRRVGGCHGRSSSPPGMSSGSPGRLVLRREYRPCGRSGKASGSSWSRRLPLVAMVPARAGRAVADFARPVPLIGSIAPLAVLQFFVVKLWISRLIVRIDPHHGRVVPACSLSERRSLTEAGSIERLWAFCVGEIVLGRSSAG